MGVARYMCWIEYSQFVYKIFSKAQIGITELNSKMLSFQKGLDSFFRLRERLIRIIAYVSIRAYGSEVTWQQICEEKLSSNKYQYCNLDKIGDLNLILAEAKEMLKTSEDRREAVMDKCKTLLTVSSLLLALFGVLLPKSLAFDQYWLKFLFFSSMLLFFNTIVLLVEFVAVRPLMSISINQKEIDLSSENLKKNLINSNFLSIDDMDNRTDYLVEIYKAARFFFMSAFTVSVILFCANFFLQSPNSEAKAVVREIQTNTNFINYVHGAKVNRGDKGDNNLVPVNSVTKH